MTFPLVCCNLDNIDAVKKNPDLQDPGTHRTTAPAGVFPIASEWDTSSVYRTHHIADDLDPVHFVRTAPDY